MKIKTENQTLEPKEQVSQFEVNLNSENKEEEEKDVLEKEIEREIDPILEVLCPEGEDFDVYREKILNELFNDAEKIKVIQNKLYQNSKDFVANAKHILTSRLRAVLEDINKSVAHNMSIEDQEKKDNAIRAKAGLLISGEELPEFARQHYGLSYLDSKPEKLIKKNIEKYMAEYNTKKIEIILDNLHSSYKIPKEKDLPNNILPRLNNSFNYQEKIQEEVLRGKLPYSIFSGNQNFSGYTQDFEKNELFKKFIPKLHYNRDVIKRIRSNQTFFAIAIKENTPEAQMIQKVLDMENDYEVNDLLGEEMSDEEVLRTSNFVKEKEKENIFSLDYHSQRILFRIFTVEDFKYLINEKNTDLNYLFPENLPIESKPEIRKYFKELWKSHISELNFNSSNNSYNTSENMKKVYSCFSLDDFEEFFLKNIPINTDLVNTEMLTGLLNSPNITASKKLRSALETKLANDLNRKYISSTNETLIEEGAFRKEFLEQPGIKEKGFEMLKTKLKGGNLDDSIKILTLLPVEKASLDSEEIRELAIEGITKLKLDGWHDLNSSYLENHYSKVRKISEYIKIPEYFLKSEEVINNIKTSKIESIKIVGKKIIRQVFNSSEPEVIYEKILERLEEIKDYKKIITNEDWLILYLSKFEEHGTLEEKKEFATFIEKISENVPHDFAWKNFKYLYEKFSVLSSVEMERQRIFIQKLVPHLSSVFLKNISFPKAFEQFLSYTSEQQDQLFNVLKENPSFNTIDFLKNNWMENLIIYVNDVEEAENLISKDEERKKKVIELFLGEYKNIALDGMSGEWKNFLKSKDKFFPPGIFLISKLIKNVGGAGNLKHVESLGNLIYQMNIILQNPKTTEKTKNEIRSLLSEQEKKFEKEKWSQDDCSEFYNLSRDIMEAAPSLYTAFSPIFKQMSPKDMKTFMKEVFPFYQAQLVIIQEISDDDVKYKPKELVNVRQSLKDIAEKMKQSFEDRKNIFNEERSRLLEIVKSGFKDRFGLIKIPEEFSKDNLRSIQNCIRYIGNISERNIKRETVIAFYLGLELNDEWDAFRQGKEIKLEDYFSGKQLDLIRPLVEEKMKGYKILEETLSISKEQMPRFQEILQEDTISNMMGNIQTIDVKLGNAKRNIEELADLDIYPNQQDKDILALLLKEGKIVGGVLAKTFSKVSGKKIEMTQVEKVIQIEIAKIFGVSLWNAEQVKRIQDAIQPFSLIANMINKMEEEKVDENIEELQKRLIPPNKIIEIFNHLGEEFKQESGAMALSKDITYLENLIVKDDKKITPEEKAEVQSYLDAIKEKMKDLENILDKVREYFNKIKKSAHLENHELLKNRLADIEKIIYSTDSNAMIVSHMTKNLNLIIENMRACLGCMRKETNNDTNLAFSDYNKFYMMNQGEKEKGSISDEILFFVPIKTPDGNQEMSFVLDRVYGSKSSDVLISNILSVFKKYQALKKEMPEAHISITISNEAMSSVGLDSEILKKRLSEVIKNVEYIEAKEWNAMIPKSEFSDNYVEFGSGSARQSGDRTFSGLVLR